MEGGRKEGWRDYAGRLRGEAVLTTSLKVKGEPPKNVRGATDLITAAFFPPKRLLQQLCGECFGKGPDWQLGNRPLESDPGKK